MELKNIETEKIAQEIALSLPDKEEAASIFDAWSCGKNLVRWEVSAIGARAMEIFKNKKLTTNK